MQKNHTLTLTKEIGKLWIIEDINPFGKKFDRFFDENLGHDISKLTFIGATNYVLDILAGDAKRMDIELCMTSEKMLFIPASSPATTSVISIVKLFLSQNLEYILKSISAQSILSVPPLPA